MKVPGARKAALNILPTPLAARNPKIVSLWLSELGLEDDKDGDKFSAGAAFSRVAESLNVEDISFLLWPTYGMWKNSEPISPNPLNVS